MDDYSDKEWDEHCAALAPDVLRILESRNFFDILDERVFPGDLRKSTCHHTFQKTLALITEQGFDDDECDDIMNVFQSRGGFCDCEVLYNAAPDSQNPAGERYWEERAKQADEAAK